MPTTSAIVKGVYPMGEKALNNTTIRNKYKKNIADFINVRSKELYDIGPFTRIYWSNDDKDKFFKLMGFTSEDSDLLTKHKFSVSSQCYCLFWIGFISIIICTECGL